MRMRRDTRRRHAWGIWRVAILTIITALSVAAAGVPAERARNLERFKHSSWTEENGGPPYITSLAQSRDGYLWVGSEKGLFRFDGVRFEHIARDGGDPKGFTVSTVAVARDGAIWVGSINDGVSVLRNGTLRDARMPIKGYQIGKIVQDSRGTIWAIVTSKNQPLARFANGRWRTDIDTLGLPADWIVDILTSRDGAVWLATMTHLYVKRANSDKFVPLPITVNGRNSLAEDLAGGIWLTDPSGLRRVDAGSSRVISLGAEFRQGHPSSFFDKQGGLWSNAGSGVIRVQIKENGPLPVGATERWHTSDGLTSNTVNSVMPDREGNVWVATMVGLDRFRQTPIVTENRIPRETAFGSMLWADRRGNVYVGTADTLYRIKPSSGPEVFTRTKSEVRATCDTGDGGVWVLTLDDIMNIHGNKIRHIPYPVLNNIGGVAECSFDRRGRLWVSAQMDGLFLWDDKRWQNFPVPHREDKNLPNVMTTDGRGRPLVFFSGGNLERIDDVSKTVFDTSGYKPSSSITTMNSAFGATLFGSKFGLGRVSEAGLNIIPATKLGNWGKPRGILQTPDGFTWVLHRYLTRFRTRDLNEAFRRPSVPLKGLNLGLGDGLPSYLNTGTHDLSQGADGRIWMVTSDGISWLNPNDLGRATPPPTVLIGAVVVDGQATRDPKSIQLPKGARSLELDYTAVSLGTPERDRFRYRLRGFDHAWVSAGTRRQAFYNDLPPGRYSFDVEAANDGGPWGRATSLPLELPPTFVQSIWFKLISGLMIVVALWAAYRFRVSRLTARVRGRLEARLAERERIARELHDTLLQGFQGLVLRFQSLAELVPKGQTLRVTMEAALDTAESVLIEGRQRVRDIRAFATDQDISDALAEYGEALAKDGGPTFRLTLEGRTRSLHPIVRDEVENIAREAMRNAFRHARASHVEVAIGFHPKEFRIGVHDDGVGIPEDILSLGRKDGHFGLVGIRERASRVGAQLSVASRADSGTEIIAIVPGRLAYRRVNKFSIVPAAVRVPDLLEA